jgi:hypothetical protein
MAHLKEYMPKPRYETFRSRYLECVRMLNGLERKLESLLPSDAYRWPIKSSEGLGTDLNPEPPET